MKTERLVIIQGTAINPKKLEETVTAKYTEPTGTDIVVIPWSWRALFGERRIALYPRNSPTPWPLNHDAIIQPNALTSAGYVMLHGPFIPTLLKRALFAALEAWRTADKVAIIMQCINTAMLGLACILLYKIGHSVHAWK